MRTPAEMVSTDAPISLTKGRDGLSSQNQCGDYVGASLAEALALINPQPTEQLSGKCIRKPSQRARDTLDASAPDVPVRKDPPKAKASTKKSAAKRPGVGSSAAAESEPKAKKKGGKKTKKKSLAKRFGDADRAAQLANCNFNDPS